MVEREFIPSILRDAGEDDEGVYTVGVRETTRPESWSLLFMECDEEDLGDSQEDGAGFDTYCLVVDPGQASHYGGVIECEVTETRLRLKLSADAARDLALPTDVTFTLELPAHQIATIKRGLARVLTSGRVGEQPVLLKT